MDISYLLKPTRERRTELFRPKEALPFGELRSDHMFVMDYMDGAWQNPRIVPYGSLDSSGGVPFPPGGTNSNYGQGIFEGDKCLQHPDGQLYTFRFDQNAVRFNTSAERLCMPQIPPELQMEAVHALIDVDRLWSPQQNGASLYIRAVMLGLDDAVGVHESKNRYVYYAFLSPSGPYYPGGFNSTVKLWIPSEFHRAVPGGTGNVKSMSNYPGTFLPAKIARERHGARQVLYLDVTNTRLEELGAMNHLQLTDDGELIFPEFTDTILPSITTRSLLELAQRGYLPVQGRQQPILLEDFIRDAVEGRIVSAGGVGTAAVIALGGEYFPDEKLLERFSSLLKGRKSISINGGQIDARIRNVHAIYTAIQNGTAEAPSGWLQQVERRACLVR